jgi:ParB-like chromosome segregation protein Spo0J
MVPVAAVRLTTSPRLRGVDDAHVEALSEIPALPPILVHRPAMTVIDGAHRLMAAKRRGDGTIAVRFFDGDDAAAYVEAVRANVSHGHPLTLGERRHAAWRVLMLHPEWSDRAVAEVCGLSPKTAGVIRRRSSGEIPQLERRVGRDGRTRPAHARRAEVPDRDTPRHALRRGWRESGQVRWADDSACRSTDTGRAFAAWFDTAAVCRRDWEGVVDDLPLSRLYDIGREARARAAEWLALAEALESRAAASAGPVD